MSFTRYLRKAFFPKHQDLQFAGKAWGGLTPIFHGSSPDPEKLLYSGENRPRQSRPVSGGKQQVCGRAGPWTRVPCYTPMRFCTSQTPGPSSPTGLLNPLDSPHHVRQEEESEFREGVVVDRPTRPGRGSFVTCGMKKGGIGMGVEPHLPDAARRLRTGGAWEWGAWDPGICAHQCPTDAHLGQRSA